MKKEIFKILVSALCLILILSYAIHISRPEKDYSKLLYDCFWTKKTHFSKDNNIIAIASDEQLNPLSEIEQLDLNNIDSIANYIEHFTQNWTA